MKQIMETRPKNYEAMVLAAAITQIAARELPRADRDSEARFREAVCAACAGMLKQMSEALRHYEQMAVESIMVTPPTHTIVIPSPLDIEGGSL